MGQLAESITVKYSLATLYSPAPQSVLGRWLYGSIYVQLAFVLNSFCLPVFDIVFVFDLDFLTVLSGL